MEGFSLPKKRSDRLVLEANTDYWDTSRPPRLRRIVFDNSLDRTEAVELVKSGQGRVDLVSGLSPLETLRVAQSPFAKVVKARGTRTSVFGMFNMRKVGSPWRDVRLRHAANFAINRTDLIRYATKGNGVIIPALVPAHSLGHDPELAPYRFDPAKARQLLREAGYRDGLAITLIAPEHLAVQATVIGKMLEQAGFEVTRQILDPEAYNQKVLRGHLDQPPEEQTWDIALRAAADLWGFPVFRFYHGSVLGGGFDWVEERPELRGLWKEALRTMEPESQGALIRQMERHTRDHAYFLFLYSPVELYAVNQAVEFVPYVNGVLNLAETSVTDQHWSVRRSAMNK